MTKFLQVFTAPIGASAIQAFNNAITDARATDMVHPIATSQDIICVGDRTSWNGGYGLCDVYNIALCDNDDNCPHNYCNVDNNRDGYAFEICSECNECLDLPLCIGDRSTWEAGYGGCDNYFEGSNEHNFCETDCNRDTCASETCSECNQCGDPVTAAPSPSPTATPIVCPEDPDIYRDTTVVDFYNKYYLENFGEDRNCRIGNFVDDIGSYSLSYCNSPLEGGHDSWPFDVAVCERGWCDTWCQRLPHEKILECNKGGDEFCADNNVNGTYDKRLDSHTAVWAICTTEEPPHYYPLSGLWPNLGMELICGSQICSPCAADLITEPSSDRPFCEVE